MNDLPICATCGVQYPADTDRNHCKICEDERQYVGPAGQQWTSINKLAADGYRGIVREEVPGLWGVGTEAPFAIGQRALLVPGEGGNVLWDSVSYLDEETVDAVRERGGISAIALSHPHYYSAMVDWSEAFGGVPIYVHAADEEWLTRRDNVELWTGDTLEILPGRTLLHAASHFAGSAMLHWAGVDGRGALAVSDIFFVAADRRWVTFMYSYPNLIPEHPDTVARAVHLADRFDYEAMYGAWWGKVVGSDAKGAVIRSAHRYFTHIGADTASLPPLPAA